LLQVKIRDDKTVSNTRTLPAARRMKLRLILISAFALLLTAQLVGMALHRLSLDKHDFPDAKVAFAARERPDIIFMGASHIDMGLNPATFDAELTKRGVDLRSFNLGIDGMSIVEMSYYAHMLLDRVPSLRYAVLSPCFQCLNVARKTNNIRSIDFFNLKNAFNFARFIFSYSSLPDPPLPLDAYLGNIISAAFRHYTNIGLGGSSAGWSKFDAAEPDFHAASFWAQRGPRGHAIVQHVIDGDELKRYPDQLQLVARLRAERIATLTNEAPANFPDFVTDESFGYFARLVLDLQARGVTVLVIQPPSLWHWQTEAAFVAKFRAQCPGQTLIDFGDAQSFRNLFLPAEIRYDDAHMNGRGAVIWSEVLADRFAELSRADALKNRANCYSKPDNNAGSGG
jgi:hypothetical protein